MSDAVLRALSLDPFGNSEIQSYGTVSGMITDMEALQKQGYTPLFWINPNMEFGKQITLCSSLERLLGEVRHNSGKSEFSDLTARDFHSDLLNNCSNSKADLVKCVLGSLLHALSTNEEIFKYKNYSIKGTYNFEVIICTLLEYCHRNHHQVVTNEVLADVFNRASKAASYKVDAKLADLKDEIGVTNMLFLSEAIFEITDKAYLQKLMLHAAEAFYGILRDDDELVEEPPALTDFMLL